jgi:uncharacterized protein (TIGR03085 family)
VPPGRNGYARLVASPNYARIERADLCDLLDRLGPDQPTLCAGWSTRDLAAHLIVRERKPTVAPGIWFKPLSGRTARVQTELAARPFDQVIAMVRRPPVWSMSGLGPVDRLVNSQEFFIHHEDVRRAQPDWAPRELPREEAAGLWRQVKLAGGLTLRRLKTSIQVVSPGFGEFHVGAASTTPVKLTGAPGELALFLSGRQAHARVEPTGPEELVDRVRAARLGL